MLFNHRGLQCGYIYKQWPFCGRAFPCSTRRRRHDRRTSSPHSTQLLCTGCRAGSRSCGGKHSGGLGIDQNWRRSLWCSDVLVGLVAPILSCTVAKVHAPAATIESKHAMALMRVGLHCLHCPSVCIMKIACGQAILLFRRLSSEPARHARSPIHKATPIRCKFTEADEYPHSNSISAIGDSRPCGRGRQYLLALGQHEDRSAV
jgi:hypothetical protein